ncbi:MAG: TIGR02281 family clan AA aspartic protease [Xanthobacteraceae bacterium]|nr:TIGR02281 family clan AA aspartic protease [Xanthobacteraceae bacterium]
MRSLIGFVLAVGLIALGLIYLERNGFTAANLNALDTSSLGVKIVIVALLALVVLGLFRGRFSAAIKFVLIWIAIVLALAIGYTYRFELRDVADRVLAEFLPGHAATRGRTVEVARGPGGNFVVATQVNGARVTMIFDTGASSVVLTHEAAKAAGLPLEVLSYSVPVETANGRTRAAPVTLQTISVGGIVERDVSALIAQPGQLRQSLLGMTFLNRLQGWEVRGDRLAMRAYP